MLRTARGIHKRITESWIVAFTCGNLFSKSNQTWEFIFEEKVLFETSKNKNRSKITSYTVIIQTFFFPMAALPQFPQWYLLHYHAQLY